MRLVGSRTPSKIEGLEVTGGITNYLIGNDASKYRTGIPNYQRVKYSAVYPGIDLVFYGNPRQLEYDFVIAPGANPNAIELEFEGATSMKVDDSGDLVLTTP